jgi:hypothetical protein
MCKALAGQIKQSSIDVRDASAAGPLGLQVVQQYVDNLATSKEQLDRWTAVPNLLQYVRDQINSPTYDLVADYNAMKTQITATTSWIATNFPNDGSANKYLLYVSLGPTGHPIYRTLTTAQLAGLRTQLDALIATID